MKKQTKEKKAALTALLDALTKAADKLAPTPTAAGIDIDPDFRHLSVELPPQLLIDGALAETNGGTREELNRRAERLEREYTDFIAARRKWRKEVADPIRANRGEMGELADPAGKLRTLRRSICDDTLFLTGLLKGGRKSPQYPTDEKAIEILAEGVKRRTRDKYKGASWRVIALSLLEQEHKNGTRPYYMRMMKPISLILRSNDKRVQTAATNWGKYLSYYAKRAAN